MRRPCLPRPRRRWRADAGAWLQRGLTLAAAERYAAAESAFGQALALAPDKVDARLGLARLAFWQGRLGEADRHVRRALAIDSGRQDAGDLLDRIDAARPRRWRIDLDAGVGHLSEGPSPWREGALRIGLAATPATTVSTALAASERFAIRDLYLEGRVGHRVSERERLVAIARQARLPEHFTRQIVRGNRASWSWTRTTTASPTP